MTPNETAVRGAAAEWSQKTGLDKLLAEQAGLQAQYAKETAELQRLQSQNHIARSAGDANRVLGVLPTDSRDAIAKAAANCESLRRDVEESAKRVRQARQQVSGEIGRSLTPLHHEIIRKEMAPAIDALAAAMEKLAALRRSIEALGFSDTLAFSSLSGLLSDGAIAQTRETVARWRTNVKNNTGVTV